jgi:hypothetical protein
MKKIVTTAAAIAALSASVALATSSHYLKVSPTSVQSQLGSTVTVSGAVGNGCQTGHKHDTATVYSKAFAGAAHGQFAGVPAFFPHLPKNGKFSFSFKLSNSVKKGTYHIGGRCGGGNFGSATLKVTPAPFY